jgi:pimeloyl-ACP methyl ester carboxylesterase
MLRLQLTAVAIVGFLAQAGQAQNAAPPHSTYVIVHGAFGGSWDWRVVDSLLTTRGHRVYRPTLTGLGERAHLASPSIGLLDRERVVGEPPLYRELEGRSPACRRVRPSGRCRAGRVRTPEGPRGPC